MKVIVCLDVSNGMLFNMRRQSQDKVLRQDILNNLNGSRLLMNEYSFKQFKEESQDAIIIEEKFLSIADKDDFCFVENVPLSQYEQKISTLIIYHWNRKYPADLYFDLELQNWDLISTEDFTGNSHEKITKEIYIRKGK